MTDIVIDAPMNRARYLHGSVVDIFVDMGDGPITFKGDVAGRTYLYPVEYVGEPADGTAFVPTTPPGHTLTGLRPYVVAHTDVAQVPIVGDTSDWGTPPPTWSPYLDVLADTTLTFGALPVGTDPDVAIDCGAQLTPPDEGFQSALHFSRDAPTTTQIVVSEYGWRFVYTPAAGDPVDVLVQAEYITQEKP